MLCHRGDPSVSVVLPTYNREALLDRAILSVLDQTYGSFELIVVDDGSTDATPATIARFGDGRVRCVRLEDNRGAAAARNVGIRESNGRFIAFQDSDDEWLPSKLESHMRVFAECDPAIGVVYSDMERIWRDGRSEYYRSPDVLPGVLLNPETSFYQVCGLGIQSTVIRRAVLAEVGGFNEAFPALEDLELFVRLSRRCAFHHLELPLVRYYETDGISKNMAAKRVARTLLLELYGRELERDAQAFVIKEATALGLTAP
jgi:glycosyltransferase involved in cell wall biosynthesis